MIKAGRLDLLANATIARLFYRCATRTDRYGAVAGAVLHFAMQLPIAGLHSFDGRIGIATHRRYELLMAADIHRAAAVIPDLMHLQI
ncbi:hypothetical protein D3C78_1773620 [compost metagenome]